MSLFQNSVLNKYIKGIDSKKAEKAWNTFITHFHNPEIQENIRNSKEEQYQGEFLIDLFVNVFGYVKNPNPNFNLTTELKNIKGAKKTDGAILQDDKAVAVIELKGTNTVDLAKVENQAFGYKNNQPGCTYVVTSNFEKLRFYIDNAVEYEEFNLFKLTKERFDTLYLCLAEENLLIGIPKQIKDQSLTREETVTKQLYKDYSQFRNEIFDDIQKQNSEYDKLTLFKKTQKLLDRFLFIFFAEDRLLLPPNSIREIVTQWTDLRDKYDEYQPLYSRFKKYFGYMNSGYEGKKYDIFAYNGGLFAPDEILDSIKISDDLLYKHTVNLSNYDFESEVSVNILGHIFEHSLTEFETIQAQLAGQEIDKNKTKRKKDGVFYTPKYITKYIVDNTVGKLCEEKKTEIGIDENEFDKERKGRKKATLKKLSQQVDDYRNWLLQITICDPACGSGAFLNQALEFLIREHRYIDELKAKLLGDAMVFTEVQNDILEKNIFGVDINEESVEIAKLSLWLRTAKKGRKLTSLNTNIKCGNSLIDDVDVVGDKAFNWRDEFPDIFNNGGFDVIIGNPPYVRQELLGKPNKEYYSKQYSNVYNGVADLYVYFYALSLNILRTKGRLGFITPNKWMERKYGMELRLFLKRYDLFQIINYGELKIFEDASTEPAILILSKNISPNNVKYFGVKTLEIAKSLDYSFQEFDKELLDDAIWKFTNKKITSILNKFKDTDMNLSKYTQGGVYYGVKTGMNEAFIIDEEKAFEIIKEDSKSQDIVRKMVEGDDFKKWHLNFSGRHIIGTFPALDLNISDYPGVKHYLSGFLPKLNQTGESFINEDGEKDKTRKKNNNEWFETQDVIDYYKLLDKPKLIYYHTASKHNFYLDLEGYCISANCYFISNADEYLQCVLNSKIFSTVKKYMFPAFGDSENGGRVRLDANKMNTLPIKEVEDNLKLKFKKIASEITIASRLFEDARIRFLTYVKSQFNIKKLSRKLQNWHDLEFGEFIKELNKAIKKGGNSKLTKRVEMEWMDVFDTKKAESQNLKSEIDKIDNEIDHMVYKLYNLSAEEIKIVEENSA